MSSRALSITVGVLVVFVIVTRCFFTVSETQIAIRTQFDAIVGSTYQPGLHFKVPFVDQVVRFEKRIVSQSYQGETFLTNDNRGLVVDFYIKWRVKDASRYYQSTGALEESASKRLSEIVKDGIKSVVAQRTLREIVTAERSAVTGDMFGNASRVAEDLGIQLIDVRVQRIDLPEDVSARVYESMKQNFAQKAARSRAEGSSAGVRIRASAERERTEIIANAERDALRVRGAGDSQAAQIYSRAYSRNPEFYAFYRSLQAYQSSIGKEGDLLVVSPDGEFFQYLKDSGKR
jgi:membrane protease subunit HflC